VGGSGCEFMFSLYAIYFKKGMLPLISFPKRAYMPSLVFGIDGL